MKQWLKDNWKDLWVYILLSLITITLVVSLIVVVFLCHQWEFMIPTGVLAVMLVHNVHQWFKVLKQKKGNIIYEEGKK